MLILIGLVVILVLTAATAFFVAQEFAYVAVDRGRLRTLADDGRPGADRALRVTSRLSFMLSGAQLGITVTALLAGYVAEPYLGQGLANVLGLTGLSESVSLSIAVVLALIVATVIQMVFGELAPKNLAIAKPEALALALARPTLAYLTVTGPIIKAFDATSNKLLRRVGIEPVEELPQGATRQDLDRIIATSREKGLLDEDTSRLLDRGLDFRDLTAAQVMMPRVDVVTVSATDPVHAVVELLDSGHSRFPVLGESVDDVVGVVAVSDLVDVAPADRRTTPIESVASTPVFVPETLVLPAVLEQLRQSRRQLAIVVDEFGGFAGIISLEDIAEELVGEIHDEDDLPESTAVRHEDGSWSVPARWRLDEVADASGIELPDSEEYETLSGLVMQELGRIPVIGDEVVVTPPPRLDDDGQLQPQPPVALKVVAIERHVPAIVTIGSVLEVAE
ncbi:CBS domain containing-hemolysin-like protein [Kribbella amoyensis]|uniref:CBS domain containing-hemolysin-like protein n=1 Tax=Kribbella amoyensis TaxID=996641 RepID=A0A561BS41_9ACTN|nr:hemolysin family protein [Kribbella amoyensis]TWD81686.1 CBS domain containing-hemolysin-like protein [Kribbella amoyensis]